MRVFVINDTAEREGSDYSAINSRAVGSGEKPKGETYAYPDRYRNRNSRRLHRLVSRTDGWENLFRRFPRSPRNDDPYEQFAASALRRLQHRFLKSCD